MFHGKYQLLFPLLLLFLSWPGVQSLECPKGQLPRHNGTVCCEPYFNCGKNHMIRLCSGDGKKDECVKCGDGQINNHVTSSIDDSWKRYTCFDITELNKRCSPDDLLPYSKSTGNCALSCECDIYKCFYGNQCSCAKQPNPCGMDEELNTATGGCVPCRQHTYKKVIGCQPCTWNETSWRLSQDLPEKRMPVTESRTKPIQHVSTQTPKEINTVKNNTYVVTTETGGPITDPSKDKDSDKGGTILWAIVALVLVVLVSLALVAALCMVAKRRRQNGDNSSCLVVCCNRLSCNNQNQSASQVEAGQGRAIANGENGVRYDRPQHAVSPMQHSNPVQEVSNQEEVPFSEMSLVGNGNTQPESLQPLMPRASNGDANEQTAQKQP